MPGKRKQSASSGSPSHPSFPLSKKAKAKKAKTKKAKTKNTVQKRLDLDFEDGPNYRNRPPRLVTLPGIKIHGYELCTGDTDEDDEDDESDEPELEEAGVVEIVSSESESEEGKDEKPESAVAGEPEEEEEEEEREETDYEDYMLDSDDPSSIERLMRNWREDTELSDVEKSPSLIKKLRWTLPTGKCMVSSRLQPVREEKTNKKGKVRPAKIRLPNWVRRDGEKVHLPMDVYQKIFNYTDKITATSLSLTNIFNFGLFYDRYAKEDVLRRNFLPLTKHRPVKAWETGFFDDPLSRPAVKRRVCLRNVIHDWFPERLTWYRYGKNSMYHGPISLRLLKRKIRREEAEKVRVEIKEREKRHEARREAKEKRQELRMLRIGLRRDRRIARWSRIANEHAEDSDYSDDHDCNESGCVLNAQDAAKSVEYESSGRGSSTDTEGSDDPDDDGMFTEDSELD